MTQYIKKLPAVFQTVTEKKFFDATFDQVFSKKDSDLLAGYIGRRNPGTYNPITDFYLPEPSKNRTWWQLEATAFARNDDTTKTNIFFYEDLLEYIESYGGNTLNQDRLFSSEYYSFGPPIDYDMFVNYQSYYWIEQGLPTISIQGAPGNPIMASDIIGQASYTTPADASPPNFTLSTGMSISLLDDPDYNQTHTIENIGNCIGIRLVPQFPDFTSGTVFEFLPWDGTIELSNGRIIDNRYWDANTWDTQAQPSSGDYITIERGSLDRNAWSRTNKWFHIEAITNTIAVTGTTFPKNATRALRPIIQFIADLNLYKSGTQFRSEIQLGMRDNLIGNPIRFTDFQNQQQTYLNSTYSIDINDGDLICFFNDDTVINVNDYAWDMFNWDTITWDNTHEMLVNMFIFQASLQLDGSINLNPYTSWSTPVLEGDIVFITEDAPYNGAQRGQTWYYSAGVWQEAFNDKTSLNQPPLFQLYDHDGVPLDDAAKYPESTFAGSEIFSYKVNTQSGATVDPVLKFPIVYTSLGQATDIVFQNDLITDRYTYGSRQPIDGYYYYKTVDIPVIYNNWNLYQPCACDDIIPPPPCNCLEVSKQRVIDKYVVGYGTEYQFQVSVTPYGYPASPDIIVSVNGIEVKPAPEQSDGYTFAEINGRLYVDLSTYLTNLLTTTQPVAPVVELQTYTHGLLDPAATGYSQIPQQLEANPNNEEIGEISASDLSQQFSSIIANQVGIVGTSFGGNNNYRDTRKNRSVGQYILQNVAPALKSMLVASSDDLSFINGLRFSQSEYTKFKNKYLRTALQLINQEFSPVQYYTNTVIVSAWVEEILKTVNISKEFSNAFAYSYMIANGSPLHDEFIVAPVSGPVMLTNYVDLSDPRNAVYFYDVTGQERLLVIGEDYEITSTNLVIEVEFNPVTVPSGSNIFVAFYQNPLPAYIPSTPTKVGAYPIYIPRIELDTSYVVPTNVIIGHDGSKTIAYGDYRDDLLLELEKRIYNLLQYRFRHQYEVPVRLESVKPGYFRRTRYSRQEYLDITESYLNKWSAMNRANYRANDWVSASATAPVNQLWKLYNYRLAENSLGDPLNLPGNWKGIYQYCYDTIYPNTRPWEMLGFSAMPDWWETEYGTPVINSDGQLAWTSSSAGLHNMWADLEAGIIRQGPRAIYDPITLVVQPQEMWARPGLSSIIPVDANGDIISVMTLFDVVYSGDPYEPFDGFDIEWIYGDGAPVEQAWMSTSAYAFSVQEFLYLMKPAQYAELNWDTIGTELSPGMIEVPGIEGPVRSTVNWQYVQNDTYSYDDEFFAWMRPKNADQIVHAETVDGTVQIRFGYQRWISDRILFLGKDIADTFGQKIRTLDVNLANKLAGFTNKDTTNTYIESVSPNSSTNSLIIPSTNFEVILHKSPIVDTYSYSGVIIRALVDGTFAVYGYDLLTSEFLVLERSNDKLIDVSVGGTPAEFRYFTVGDTYQAGDIVRYNGIYYVSNTAQVAVTKFEPNRWQKLKGLPTVGGISVTYKPISTDKITKVPYGTVLPNAQAVFDLLIGWGAYLESRGWKFDEVSQQTNLLSDWLASAKQFLFWLNTEWAPDASIQLSPLANKATLVVDRGYPNDVESMTNGVYSILDKYGVAIAPDNTTTDRDGRAITVEPSNLATGGIFFLQVTTSETEHVLIFDNTTSFNDIVYSPLLRARQQRLRFNGFRSNNWYGKMEAPGYLVIDDQLVPNYDTIVNDMRYYYDPNVTIDNPSLEELGRHLIGYESKSYLDNLQVSNDVQYLFYQGAIRQKGTQQAFDKLFRSNKVQGNKIIEVFEEWALKLGDFGNTVEQVSTEFKLRPEQNTGEVIVARLNYMPSKIGFVRQINILNAQNTYKTVPKVVITAPDADPTDPLLNEPLRQAKAYIVLDSLGKISRVDITDPGYGYLKAPHVEIDSGSEPHNFDRLYSVWQGEIVKDEVLDNIIDIDIDETDIWTVRPTDPTYSLVFPETSKIDYPMPNAGYVNFNDVDLYSFDVDQTAVRWGTTGFNPLMGQPLWVAKTFTEDWDVYKVVKQNIPFEVIRNANDDLMLVTPDTYMLTPQFAGGSNSTDFGNLVTLQVIEATAIATAIDATSQATATAYVAFGATATAALTSGEVTDIQVVSGGRGYTTAPAVTIDPPPAVPGARQATAIAVINDGEVTDITITDNGAGYATTPTVVVSLPPENTQILEIVVDNAGNGYTSTPNVTITGDGFFATAVAIMSGDTVASIQITNQGIGYTLPIVTIDPPFVVGIVEDITVVKSGSGYINPPVITIDPPTLPGVTAEAIAYISNGEVTSIEITNPGSGYTTSPNVTIEPPMNVNPDTNYLVAFEYSYTDAGKNYYNLITLNGSYITATDIPEFENFTDLGIFKTMRFLTTPVLGSYPYIEDGDKIWVDQVNNLWTVYSVTSGDLVAFRQQEKLINTSLFESASVFATNTTNELVQLPVFDPFKNILPGPAKQNITYTSLQDPARYNVTSEQRLFNENIMFGKAQVGQLWWDLSSARYVYYEQPKALDGSETNLDNLIYRRDRWGQLFPGSTVDIYEWVESDVPPAQYSGTGTPRDTTSYVELVTSNRFTNVSEIKYYFWVLNTTDKPNIENRTLAALDVSRLLQAPKSQGFVFFAPLQQTNSNNSYMFYNVQDLLAYRGDNVQIQYRVSERDDQKHTQWSLFREGDPNSVVTDQFWNKMVDSLCGYTRLLPISDEYDNGIIIADDLPWDIYGWDITPWDSATIGSEASYGEILEVPDPTLSDGEKYGIQYRPRQSMFVNIYSARKVFVQAANSLLKHIPIRDDNPGWDDGVLTDTYWSYTNWYAVGYEDATPTVVFQTLAQANAALVANQLKLGDIVQVTNGTIDGRYVLYAVIQLNPNVAVYSLEEIGIQNSAIKLLDTIYTVKNVYGLSVELRQLLNAFRTEVMVDNNKVDQNELYFSMINYVLSEQKNPDWVFKTSYIYVKENDLPLTQDLLYSPDQIDNIVSYIEEAKPYHTKIRDYTSTYLTSDIAPGIASDGLTHYMDGDTPVVEVDPNAPTIYPRYTISLKFGPDALEGDTLAPYPQWMAQDTNTLDATYGWSLAQTGYQLPWDALLFTATAASTGNRVPINDTTNILSGMLVEMVSGTGELAPMTTITAVVGNVIYFSQDPVVPLAAGDQIRVRHTWDIPVDSFGYPLTMNRIVNQIVSGNTPEEIDGGDWPGNTVELVPYTGSELIDKMGYSSLFPYKFVAPTFNDPQTFIPPESIVGVQLDDTVLYYGQDYYAVYNEDTSDYTVYFYNDPGWATSIIGLVWFDGGNLQNVNFDTYRNELAIGFPKDDLVVNVDTKLPVILNTNDNTTLGFGGMWDYSDPAIEQILVDENGGEPSGGGSWLGFDSNSTSMWDASTSTPLEPGYEVGLLDNTISYRENLEVNQVGRFYRNCGDDSGELYQALEAPLQDLENIQTLVVTATSDIFPDPIGNSVAVWIESERIEYMSKLTISPGIWELGMIRRGTNGTAPTAHQAGAKIWVEPGNVLLPVADQHTWNAIDGNPDPASYLAPNEFGNVVSVPAGGLWYAQTPEAVYLKACQGKYLN